MGGGLGIDVSETRLHCVELSPAGRVVRAERLTLDRLDELARWAAAVGVVAIDAPADPSTLPHTGDTTLPPKFRAARCAEVALGVRKGVWVSWVTPPSEAASKPWMRAGFALYRALRRANGDGVELLETYPAGIFRTLAGGRIAPKSTHDGLERRVELLRGAGIGDRSLPAWGHDGLDAAAAALVALRRANGGAERVSCGHDGSAIWMPAAPIGG